MNTLTKTLGAAAIMAGGTIAMAPEAHADNLRISLNLGGPAYYQPAPIRVVEHRMVHHPVYYHPAPVKVVYRDAHKHWKKHDRRKAWHGHGHGHGPRMAYGYR